MSQIRPPSRPVPPLFDAPAGAPLAPSSQRPWWAILGVVALVAVAAIGAELVLLQFLRRQPPAPAAPAAPAEPQHAAVPERAAPAPPPERPRGERPVVAVVRESGAGPAVGVPPAARASQEALATGLGALSAAHLYQTYLNLGLLADAVEKDVYTPAAATKLLEEVTALMDTVDRQLQALPDDALKPEERRTLEKVRAVLALERTQARELQAYWDTDDEAHAQKFQKAREEAWAAIKALLALPD